MQFQEFSADFAIFSSFSGEIYGVDFPGVLLELPAVFVFTLIFSLSLSDSLDHYSHVLLLLQL